MPEMMGNKNEDQQIVFKKNKGNQKWKINDQKNWPKSF